MSNSEKATDKKNSKSNKADEASNAVSQSDTCLLNSLTDPQNGGVNLKKNKYSKHTTVENSQKSYEKGFKKKFVNKVMSWNNSNKTKDFISDELARGIEGISLSPDNSEDNLCKPDWLRARDSLENLLNNRTDKPNTSCRDIINSKSAPFSSNDKSNLSESPHSEAALGSNKTPAQSIAKVLNWDPWDKLGRKNKRENKRRKVDKTPPPIQPRDNSIHRTTEASEACRVDLNSGDENRENAEDQEEYPEMYEYQPYNKAKNSKSVDFTNEVMVVYFTGDEVVGEVKEPLKKELEQQIRNKEMRKGHCPAMLATKRKQTGEDYLSAWFRK